MRMAGQVADEAQGLGEEGIALLNLHPVAALSEYMDVGIGTAARDTQPAFERNALAELSASGLRISESCFARTTS